MHLAQPVSPVNVNVDSGQVGVFYAIRKRAAGPLTSLPRLKLEEQGAINSNIMLTNRLIRCYSGRRSVPDPYVVYWWIRERGVGPAVI